MWNLWKEEKYSDKYGMGIGEKAILLFLSKQNEYIVF
jgi:hypothetical protein